MHQRVDSVAAGEPVDHRQAPALAPAPAAAAVKPAIIMDGAAKRYGRHTAVHRIDLRLPPGSVCGLVGPNGAGKTTTIGMLLGLIRRSAGEVRVLGLDPARQSFQLRQRVGYVPERHHIYEWMKVRKVLRFASAMYPTWSAAECGRLAELFGLPLTRQVKQLSKGELAKLALTIALSHEPQLLILDEPTSGLDPVVRREVLRVISELIRHRPGCTVLFSSHILSDIERVADRVIVMNGGRVIADDAPDALRARYVKASLLFDRPPAQDREVPEAVRVERSLREWVVIFPPIPEQRVRQIAADLGARDCMIQPASLDDVFLELMSPAVVPVASLAAAEGKA